MKLILSCLMILSAKVAFADPTFTNITSSDFDDIAQDMSANFLHNSMLGASTMGSIFGIQVGLTAAQTNSSRTDTIVKRNAGAELPNLYNSGILVAVGIPLGIAFEGVLFPKMTSSGASLSSTSLAVKYNMNSIVPVLPVNLSLRGIYSTSSFSFEQTVSSVNTSVESKNSVTGLQLLLSPMLPIFEPYVGVGILNGSNELSVTGATTIFDSSFSTAQSEKKSNSTTQILAGVDVSLLLLKLGFEYSQAFGTNRYGLKFALGF